MTACEGGARNGGSSPSADGPAQTAVSTTLQEGTTGNVTPVQRVTLRDVAAKKDVPPGVARQFSYFGGGDGVCNEDDQYTSPTVYASRKNPELGMTFELCFPLFDSRQGLEVQIRLPTGKLMRKSISPEWNSLPWEPRPEDPLGKYKVSVRQGSLSATTEFNLVEASRPSFRVIQPEASQTIRPPKPGDTFELVLVGYPPNRPVHLHVYVPNSSTSEKNHDYRSTLQVSVNSKGHGHVLVATMADDPSQCLLFVPDPPDRDGYSINNELCVYE